MRNVTDLWLLYAASCCVLQSQSYTTRTVQMDRPNVTSVQPNLRGIQAMLLMRFGIMAVNNEILVIIIPSFCQLTAAHRPHDDVCERAQKKLESDSG